jgi:hypothetical protein
MTTPSDQQIERMANETSLLPHVVADSVIQELAVHLDRAGHAPWLVELLNARAREMADTLGRRAAAIYCANAEHDRAFARDLRSVHGRDLLYAFTQHWLAGLLFERHGQAALDALPSDFARGKQPPQA